jgi:hypothetical protein
MCEGANTNLISWPWMGESSSPLVKEQVSVPAIRVVRALVEVVIPLQDTE